MTCADAALLAGHQNTTPARAAAFILARTRGEYTPHDVERVIVPEYFRMCAAAGLDACMVIAQCCLETDYLSSALSQRRDRDGNNLRNPAGIGVTGETSKWPRAGFVWDSDRRAYRACVGFRRWEDAIRAHVGRILAYALTDVQATGVQTLLIRYALSVRGLPVAYRGVATTWRDLGGTWAPSAEYGERIAAIARGIVG